MKHAYLYLILLSFLACKKASDPTTVTPAILKGKWEIRQAAGQILIDYPSGNGHILEFTSNGFTYQDSGKVKLSGSYVITQESTIVDGCQTAFPETTMDRLVTDPIFMANKLFVKIEGGQLKFQSGCSMYDGAASSIWARIQ